MRKEWYEVFSLAARYWFTFLIVVIVWRAFKWLRMDTRARKRVLRELPDSGYIGLLYVLEGTAKTLHAGDSISLPVEGMLGSASGCDARVPHGDISGRHALFEFREDGLHLRPYREELLQVDDQLLPAGCEAILQHGAVIAIGSVKLQLRLFSGVDAHNGDIDLAAEAPPEVTAKRKRVAPPRPVTQATIPVPPVSAKPAGKQKANDKPADASVSLPRPVRIGKAGIPKAKSGKKQTSPAGTGGRKRAAPDDNPIYGEQRPRR